MRPAHISQRFHNGKNEEVWCGIEKLKEERRRRKCIYPISGASIFVTTSSSVEEVATGHLRV